MKIWFDASGRVDVNFFHVSVPDIEVYSDLPNDGDYDQKGTTILSDRYIRHEFQRGTTNEQSWNIVGTWYATRIDGSLDPEGDPLEVTGDVSTWVFNSDGTYFWFLHALPYYYLDDTGTYTYENEWIVLNGRVSALPAKGYIECPTNSRTFTFLDGDNDRWIYELNE
ncbi:MAG: hypothetical protein U9R60_12250 [Bacteroidota bacterium]|nr:hypothetical protein [Bacteroidota bacterium]